MIFSRLRHTNYALALLATGAAFSLRQLVQYLTGADLPYYIAFFPIVLIVLLAIGRTPAILAAAAAAAYSAYWYLSPTGSNNVANTSDGVGLALFVLSGACLCLLSEIVRQKVDAYQSTNEQLVREISLRRQTEEYLASRERDLSQTQMATHLGSWKWDIVNDKVTWSKELYRIFGVDPQTFIPTNTRANELIHPDDRDMHNNFVAMALTGVSVGPFECRLCPPGGEERIVLASGFDVEFDSFGNPVSLLGTIFDLTEQKLAERKISEYQQKLQSMVIELSMAEERERCRIAGELHDQVGQNLILCKMKLDALMELLQFGEPFDVVAGIETIIDQAIQDIRSLTFQMRPSILVTGGLGPALHWLSEELHATSGLKVELKADYSHKPLRHDVNQTVFQAARELMLNVAKHAGTNACRVTLNFDDDFLTLLVEDDGIGLQARSSQGTSTMKGGFGLFNVQQRIEHLGGRFSVEDKVAGGVLATIMVPTEACG